MKTQRIFAVIGLASFGLLTQASHAEAASSAVIKMAPGIGGQTVNGTRKKNAGPGQEQGVAIAVKDAGKQYIVTVFMSSNIPGQNPNDNVNQLKCSSVELTPTGPVTRADQVQITDNRGDRPGNHPAIAADEAGHIVYLYGANKNNATNVSTYAGVLNTMCQVTTPDERISSNNNNNEGAPDVAYAGGGVFQGGYYSNGNNSAARAVGLKITGSTLTRLYDKAIVAPSNIGRPAIVATAGDRSLFCAAKGNNRPPEVGVECHWLEVTTGTSMSKSLVAASNPAQNIYYNQPSVAMLDNGNFVVQSQMSNGGGKNNNNKGSNTAHMYVVTPSDTSIAKMSETIGATAYQNHSSLCAGAYGVGGKRHAAVLGMPSSGNGQPVLQMASYSADAAGADKMAVDIQANKWIVGWYGDAGMMANIYGQNPGQQGRNFMKCIGDVPNPGYHVMGGFMADVETFFAVPHEGRINGDMKNAEWLTLVPGKSDNALPPEGPKDPGSIPPGNVAPSDSPAAPGNPNAPNPANPANPTNPAADGPGLGQPAGCACSVPSTSTSSNTGGAVALLGLGIVLAARRRRGEG